MVGVGVGLEEGVGVTEGVGVAEGAIEGVGVTPEVGLVPGELSLPPLEQAEQRKPSHKHKTKVRKIVSRFLVCWLQMQPGEQSHQSVRAATLTV